LLIQRDLRDLALRRSGIRRQRGANARIDEEDVVAFSETLGYRRAETGDAPAVAALHVDSWRRHYRGAYSDAFLDGGVEADRLATWTERLAQPNTDAACALVAEQNGAVVGFAYTIWGDDPQWGSLLENLHVVYGQKGQGVGTQLMARTAQSLLQRGSVEGLYLWVLEQNKAAQAFYEARGGVCVERGFAPPPGGDPERLAGAPRRFRYVWHDPSELLLWLRV
jgi:ribosomal protein S18 acetylase RimI-like enzyme